MPGRCELFHSLELTGAFHTILCVQVGGGFLLVVVVFFGLGFCFYFLVCFLVFCFLFFPPSFGRAKREQIYFILRISHIELNALG